VKCACRRGAGHEGSRGTCAACKAVTHAYGQLQAVAASLDKSPVGTKAHEKAEDELERVQANYDRAWDAAYGGD
jgi:hypothetical protein